MGANGALFQPQQAPLIDRSNPITRGLTVAILPLGGTFIDVINNKFPTTATLAPTPGVLAGVGRVTQVLSGDHSWVFTGDVYTRVGPGGAFTEFAIVAPTTLLNDYGTFWSSCNTTPGSAFLTLMRRANNTNNINWSVDNGSAGTDSAGNELTTLTDGKAHTLLGCNDSGEVRIDVDGKVVATTTGTAASSVASGRLILFDDFEIAKPTQGSIGLYLRWERKISEAESRSLKINSWQVFYVSDAPLWAFDSGGAAGVTATLSVTDATDTLSSTAAAAVTATLSRTDATDTLSATTTEPVTASLAVTDATDTLSSAAAAQVVATLSATDATDTLSGAAAVKVTALLTATDAADTLSATTTEQVIASVAVTDATDALSSAAAVAVSAALAVTDANDTLASTTTEPVTAALAVTDAADTASSAAAAQIAISASVTDGADTLSSTATTGAASVDVTLSATDATDTLSATAAATVVAMLAITDATDGLASAAAAQVVITSAATDAADTLVADAFVGSAPVSVSLNVTDATDALDGAAALSVAAQLSHTDAADALESQAAVGIAAALSLTDAADTLVASSAATVTVTLDATDADDTLASTASALDSVTVTLTATDQDDTLSSITAVLDQYGLTAAAVWSQVLSNGKTAEQNVVEIREALSGLGVWGIPIEGSFTGADLLRVIAAVQAGKSTITALGGGAATVEFRAVDDSEVRVTADMQGSERTEVTLNVD